MRALVTICLLAGFVAGCGKGEGDAFAPKPFSPLPHTMVVEDAIAWARRAPAERYWADVTPTGSMAPFVTEKNLVLCVRYKGQLFPDGATLVFHRGDQQRVLHVAIAQTETHVKMSGYANERADGWFPKTAIEGILVGQLSLP